MADENPVEVVQSWEQHLEHCRQKYESTFKLYGVSFGEMILMMELNKINNCLSRLEHSINSYFEANSDSSDSWKTPEDDADGES